MQQSHASVGSNVGHDDEFSSDFDRDGGFDLSTADTALAIM